MKLIIAGASGYIGRSLVHLAVEHGHQVLMLLRRRSEALAPYGEQASIDEAKDLIGSSADALINAAGTAHVRGTIADFDIANRRLPLELAACVLDGRVGRMIHLSSLGVYGNWSAQPITEMSKPSPMTPYAESKLRADHELVARFRSDKDRLTVVRPPMVYGAGCPGNFARLYRLVTSGIPLPFGAAHARRSFIFVNNLVDFLLQCSEMNRPSGLFVLGDGSDYSTSELIREISLILGNRAINIAVPVPWLHVLEKAPGVRRAMDSLTRPMLVDWTSARNLIGWTPPVRPADAMTMAISPQ